MSDSNPYDWTKPITGGTFSLSHGLVSAPACTLSSCAPSGYIGELVEKGIIPGIGPVPPVPSSATSQSALSQVVKAEWIIPGIGPVPPSGRTADPADTLPEAPSSSTSVSKSYSKPEWATPIDQGFIHPEVYTTKIVGIDPVLPSRLADAQLLSHVAHCSINITSHGVKTPPPTVGPPPNTPSKQAGVKTPPPTAGLPPNTPSRRSVGTQTCIKATHLPVYLPLQKCAYPTNRTIIQFVEDVDVITGGSFEPGPSHTKEPKRLRFHRHPIPANILDPVQEIKVSEHIVSELSLRENGTPPPAPSFSSNTASKQAGVTEAGVKTAPPSPGPPANSPSKNLSKDGTQPPAPSPPSNIPAKRAEERADFSKDGTPPSPSPPPNSPSKELSKDGTPRPPTSVPPNTPAKRITLITDFVSKVVKDRSPRLPPPPLPNTLSKELDKGGGGAGETPPPPSPPPNSPTELSKNGTPPPPPSPPPNSLSKKLSKDSTPPNTPVKSKPDTRRLSLVIPDGHREPYCPTNPKQIADLLI